jgi:hypothetical protein
MLLKLNVCKLRSNGSIRYILYFISTSISIGIKELLLKRNRKKEISPLNIPWKVQYKDVDYIDWRFGTDHRNEFFVGLLSEIN